jgi:hypothetical protein
MGKMVTLSLKLPDEIQKKLKIASTLTGQSMTNIISDFVDKMDIAIPDFLVKKTTVKKEIKKKGIYDPEKVKERVLALQAEKLTYGKIAERLDAEGIATRQGGSWSSATVSNIYRRAKAAEVPGDASKSTETE